MFQCGFIYMLWLNHVKALSQFFPCQRYVIFCLEVQPVSGTVSKVTAKAYRGVGSHCALAKNDLIDASGGHAYGSGQLVLAELIRLHILLEQYFAGVLMCHDMNITNNVI